MKQRNNKFISTLVVLITLLFFLPLQANTQSNSGSNIVPKGLWEAFSEARHAVEENTDKEDTYVFRAYNPGNRYGIRYGEQGLKLTTSDWEFKLRLKAYGQKNTLQHVQNAKPTTEGNRVSFDRGTVNEWYVNDSKGLEQGFTLQQPKNHDAKQGVILSLAYSGDLQGRWKNQGQSIAFYKGDKQAFTYEKLLAFDARGKTLHSQLMLTDQGLQIHVDTKNAQWPVTVDPIFATEQKVVGTTSDAAANDDFGNAIAMDGNTAVIGARYDDDNGSSSGSAYVLIKTAAGWLTQEKLTASNAANSDYFGSSVALSGDTVLIGAPGKNNSFASEGSAYIFTRLSNNWTQQAILTRATPSSDQFFGESVALSGDTALVGAHGVANFSGEAYIYVKPGGGWTNTTQTAMLYATDWTDGDRFGQSVSLSGDTALIGARLNDDAGTNSGSAYIFEKPGTGWGATQTETAKLTASDAVANDWFGSAVSLSGNAALVGAAIKNGAAGSAYIFEKPGGGWTTTTQTAKLTASDATGGDYFGDEVSLSGDTAVVGAFAENNFAGSAYVFVKQGGAWTNMTQTAKLTASDAIAGDSLGTAVAISGDTVLISAVNDDDGGINSGSTYVFEKPVAGWSNSTQSGKLGATKSNAVGDFFGESVSLSGNMALIGAPYDDDGANDSGTAYIFTHSGNKWRQQAKLKAADAAADDVFGRSVSLYNNTALIGANGDDHAGLNSGSAYVFVRSGSNWIQQAKLTSADTVAGDNFGFQLALYNDTAIINAAYDDDNGSDSGSAYIFTRSSTNWAQQAKLIAADAASGDLFGYSVALYNDTALISAVNDDDNGNNSGSAYIFTRSGSSWSQQTKLTAADAAADDSFGLSVALYADTALIGASADDDVASNSGSAYVYTRSGNSWNQQAKLTAADAAASDGFGVSVTLFADTALVGAMLDDAVSADDGSAYLFTRSGSHWFQQHKLTASDATTNDYFGTAVALSADTALAGASWDDNNGAGSGSAYFNRFECGFAGPIVASRWHMIGAPCALNSSADTIGELFGDTLDITKYYYRWVVYKRNHANDTYSRLNPGDPVVQGEGYWLFSLDTSYWDATGSLTTYPITIGQGCSDPEGCFEITLTSPVSAAASRYNLVGHPGNTDINWGGVRFLVDGVSYEPSNAEVLGFASKSAWDYNGSSYDTFDDNTPGMEGTLDSHGGVWVKLLGGSFGKTVKLLVPVNNVISGPPGPPTVMLTPAPTVEPIAETPQWLTSIIDFLIPSAQAAKPQWEQEWYMRIIAESPAESLKDRGNVLGQLLDSMNSFDSHDLIELNPFASPYLTVVFPHDDWPQESGNYASDYHSADYWGADQWVFQVKSDDPYREVILYWEGINLLDGIWSQNNGKRSWSKSKQADGIELMQRMWLEDMDTGEQIEATINGANQSYTFSMGGSNIRNFRWVLDSHNGKPPKAKKIPPGKLKQAAKPEKGKGLGTPPQPGK